MTRDARSDELAANLHDVEARVAAACAAAGRPRSAVSLVVVTKTWPVEDVLRLAALGVTDVGENRDQEAAPKARACAEAGAGLTWHFVGRLQTNKCRSVAGYADVVHSLDRPGVVEALGRAAVAAGRELTGLVQVSLDPAGPVGVTGPAGSGRSGAAPAAVPALADLVARTDGLRLGGVMAVAPLGADPAPAFARLAEVAARVIADHPAATTISAGMSGDLEQAVAAGATHVRVGSAVLGPRPPLG